MLGRLSIATLNVYYPFHKLNSERQLHKLLNISPVQPSRTSERRTNGPKTCFRTFSNSVPNPAPISRPSDISVCVSSGISARAFTFCQLDSARCGYGCAGGGCAENPAIC